MYLLAIYFALTGFIFENIMIPCPIKLVTNHSCWGCGLSRSVLHICKGEIIEAWETHRAGIVLFPLLLIIVIIDFIKLLKQSRYDTST